MWNIIKEYRHYLATLVLVIVPVIALNAGGKNPADLHWFDRAAVAVSTPVQAGIRWSIDTSWDAIQSYLLLWNTQDNNKTLALENRKLLNELASFQEVARENDRLRQLVDFNNPMAGRKIVARVIAQDVSPEFRLIRLNKGANEGVESGMAVVALEGVVGRVIRVGRNWSDVLSLLDGSSAIDAILQRNRVRGVIEGQGGQQLAMKYLRRTDPVEEGDVVVSSGIGGLFPKGLTIGKVTSVKKKNFGISQTVEVVPSVDFNRLEEVTVIDPPKVPLEQATLEVPVSESKSERKSEGKAEHKSESKAEHKAEVKEHKPEPKAKDKEKKEKAQSQ
ncbi:MAG: rod shape-determining protein MreC [Bdellovibrionota bacterium]